MLDVRYNLSCWEEGAVCGACEMELMKNETMIFSVSNSNTLAAFAILISLLGFAINLISLVSLLINNHVRHQLNTPYIISVLFTDLFFCAFVLPMLASRYYNRQAEANCNLFPVLFYICLGAFILSLMLLTMIRTCILFFSRENRKYPEALGQVCGNLSLLDYPHCSVDSTHDKKVWQDRDCGIHTRLHCHAR
jgi:hypothetical protein